MRDGEQSPITGPRVVFPGIYARKNRTFAELAERLQRVLIFASAYTTSITGVPLSPQAFNQVLLNHLVGPDHE